MKIFLILFLIIVAIYLWYVFLIVYHLIRFGIGKEPKIISLIFFFGSCLFLILVIFYFTQINWQEILKFFQKK